MPLPLPPSWDAWHPLVIHFPIALLLVAPIFIVLGILFPKAGKNYSYSALILMVLGTLGLYIAISTGEAAGQLVERTAQIQKVLEAHEELAELSSYLFTGLTVTYAALLFLPVFLKKIPNTLLSLSLNALFLIGYAGAVFILVWAAHEGGLLANEFGVRATVNTASWSL